MVIIIYGHLSETLSFFSLFVWQLCDSSMAAFNIMSIVCQVGLVNLSIDTFIISIDK